MNYKVREGYGECVVCKCKLIVKSWKRCEACDAPKKKQKRIVTKKQMQLLQEKEERKMKRELYGNENTKHFYLGYQYYLDYKTFLNARELVYDDTSLNIIGWK